MIKKDESFVLNGFSARDTDGVILTQTITRMLYHKAQTVACRLSKHIHKVLGPRQIVTHAHTCTTQSPRGHHRLNNTKHKFIST